MKLYIVDRSSPYGVIRKLVTLDMDKLVSLYKEFVASKEEDDKITT